tara:strand:- start:95 stop:1429 length:1335 start_codon:yes stop_codon:yes gene_type:complete
MEFLTQAAQFILSLSILIVLHELGHMLPARWFKTRVEKFYLFFDAGFSLFKFKKGDTEYGIGWIPLGGYVKISGMIDESMDKEQMKEPAKPWEFRSKPAWQRLIIMIGGVTVNLVLGFIIYMGILMYWGSNHVDTNKLTEGMDVHPYMAKYEIESGDVIESIDGESITSFDELNKKVLLRNGRTLSILKQNGTKKEVSLPEEIDMELFHEGVMPFVQPRTRLESIKEVIKDSPAQKAGLMKGDKILAINNREIHFFDDLKTPLYENRSGKVNLIITRDNDTIKIDSVNVNKNGEIGFVVENPRANNEAYYHQDYNFGEGVFSGFNYGLNTLGDYVSQFKFIFTKKGAGSIGGFGTIGSLYGKVWDWQRFWGMTALLSIILAFMNILPIPALDGGHVMFLIYEIISGKPPSDKFLTKAQVVGMVILLSLLVYANGMDIVRWLSGS